MLGQCRLSDEDRVAVRRLVEAIAQDPTNLGEKVFLGRAALFAHKLPETIRESLHDFRLTEKYVGILITNNPVFVDDVGPTPQAHGKAETRKLNLPQLMHGLYASLLGEPFGFKTQQYGRVFNDLIPLQGYQGNSSSGDGHVGLHTEDCFELFMPDYLGFLCLRNDERAVTVLSSLCETDLEQNGLRILFDEYVSVHSSSDTHFDCTTPRGRRRVLFGDLQRPYMQINAGRIDTENCSPEIRTALGTLFEVLEANRFTTVLAQGDCLYLDNFMAVHGRSPYQPNYGPGGRWFCRLVMTRDLRKTRSLRASPEARVMDNDSGRRRG